MNRSSLFVCLLLAIPAYAETPAKALEARCAERTKVLDWNAGLKGEKMDGFCHGYLVGIFEAMSATKAICPSDKELVTPEFLWSLVQTFKKEAKEQPQDARDLAFKAFARSFPCKK